MVQRLQWRGLRTQVSPLSLKCGLGRISLYSCRSWRKSFKYKDPKMTWLMMASAQPSAGSNVDEIRKLKRQLSNEFEMKDLGPTK
ncbi:uncharacterized protein LOC131168629 isoform X2 [Malania oleifera]|uniref:uncharacterized protein LOC131168629 isoform X2 n=1 Tax=Malania oleifera TaxID=397392 RepID=UPI0025ADADAB|nr:uncharacterized protein LOC131168629 isoform X2 [Malania oleifera]